MLCRFGRGLKVSEAELSVRPTGELAWGLKGKNARPSGPPLNFLRNENYVRHRSPDRSAEDGIQDRTQATARSDHSLALHEEGNLSARADQQRSRCDRQGAI